MDIDLAISIGGIPIQLSYYHHGQLEILINKRWSTVSSDTFDENAAMVVCRQLGFIWWGIFLTNYFTNDISTYKFAVVISRFVSTNANLVQR